MLLQIDIKWRLVAKSEYLTQKQIVDLARTISAVNMESIALGYLGLEIEHVMNLKAGNIDNPEAFNRNIIRTWSNMTVDNQVQVG